LVIFPASEATLSGLNVGAKDQIPIDFFDLFEVVIEVPQRLKVFFGLGEAVV